MAIDPDEVNWEIPQRLYPWVNIPKDPGAGVTLADARADLHKSILDGEERTCPCCSRKVAVTRGMFTGAQAKFLVRLVHLFYQRNCEDWIFWKDTDYTARDYTCVRYNRLALSQNRTVPPGELNGQNRFVAEGGEEGGNGNWVPTQAGVDFVMGRLSVPRFVVMYYGLPLGASKEQVTIRQIEDKKFDYDEAVKAYPIPGGL